MNQDTPIRLTRVIEEYLDGTLSQIEKERLEERASRDRNLSALIHLHREVNESIRNKELFRLKACLDQFNHKHDLPVINYAFRIAAIVVIALSVYFIVRSCILQNMFVSSTYDRFYAKYQTDIECRTMDMRSSLFNTALSKYEAGLYKECIQILDSMVDRDTGYYVARFFLGLSYLEVDNQNAAIHSFLSIPDKWESPFCSHRDWYLALAYLKKGRNAESYQVLKKLASGSGYYSKDAKTIIRRIRFGSVPKCVNRH